MMMIDAYRLHMHAAGLAARTVEGRVQLVELFLDGRRPETVARDDVARLMASASVPVRQFMLGLPEGPLSFHSHAPPLAEDLLGTEVSR